MKKNKKYKKKKSSLKYKIRILLYELIIVIISVPLLTFYGPFENVKRTIVGTAMATFSHQYIATIFLSKDKINEILQSDTKGETTTSEKENLSNV